MRDNWVAPGSARSMNRRFFTLRRALGERIPHKGKIMSKAIPVAQPAPAVPPGKRIHPLVWVGVAVVAAHVLFIGLAIIVGIGFTIWDRANAAKTGSAAVVGRWELGVEKAAVEFRADGTGVFESPIPELFKTSTKKQLADLGITDGIVRNEFKWRIDEGQNGNPVLVVESKKPLFSNSPFLDMSVANCRVQTHEDMLTITPLQDLFQPIILRRIK